MNIRQSIISGPGAAFAPKMFADLDSMEKQLLRLCADSGELNSGLARVVSSGGKRLRPLLAWACWSMCGEKMPVLPLMCMLEMMHTASLIHDDFVDDAKYRRGVLTINADKGALAAIRSGDYLLARAMELLEHYRGTGINEALSQVSQQMCLGELEQRDGLFKVLGTDEQRYYARIRRKTALLMAESCAAGAVAGGGEESRVSALRRYGEHLGMAFQIRDDYMDFFDGKTGKSALQDIKTGVITLPIIIAAKQCGNALAEAVERRCKDEKTVRYIKESIKKTDALKKTADVLRSECEKACYELERLPDCPQKAALALLAKSLWEVKDLV